MKSDNEVLTFKLLPNKYKKLVYALFIIPITFGILKSANIVEWEDYLFKRIFTILFFTPLILLVFTAEKVEDERIQKIRLNALAFAAVYGFGYLVIANIMDLAMSNEASEEIKAKEILLHMIVMYLCTKFYMLRNN